MQILRIINTNKDAACGGRKKQLFLPVCVITLLNLVYFWE